MTRQISIMVGGWFGMVLAVFTATAEPPVVRQIEPPSWWTQHTWNPVRVLIEGSNLAGARLTSADGIQAGAVSASTNGNWAFVDLTISPAAKPGRRMLILVTSDGSTKVPFDLLRRWIPQGRFQGFNPDDVIYLAMPDRFADGELANNNPPSSPGLCDRSKPRHYHGGDLAGVIQHLPYLKDLGATALWLTPWYDNVNHLNQLEKYTADNRRAADGAASTDYHGYGAVDFYGVEEHFGDQATLVKLVQAAHRHRIKIIQDQVANHTGPYHRWAANSPTATWFNGTVANHLENTWQTWTIAEPNPPTDKLKSTLEGWFINLLPDLNQNDPETAVYLIQNSLWWIGLTGLDAVRQDTLPYVPRSHWSRWTAALKREYPRLNILGEMWDGNPKLVAFFQGGRPAFDGIDTGVDTLFDFPLCYAIRDVFAKKQPMTRLAETLAADTNYVSPRVLVTFLGLHDMPRFLNEPGADVVGLNLAFSFLLTTRGIPLIYYGDEVALPGGGDPDNRRDFPGGFPGDAQNAFAASGRSADQALVFDHVQTLLRLRKQLEPLRRGDQRVIQATNDRWISVRRTDRRLALILINNGTQSLDLELAASEIGLAPGHTLRARLGPRGRTEPKAGKLSFLVPARSAAVYSD
jgi:neopullulanase